MGQIAFLTTKKKIIYEELSKLTTNFCLEKFKKINKKEKLLRQFDESIIQKKYSNI